MTVSPHAIIILIKMEISNDKEVQKKGFKYDFMYVEAFLYPVKLDILTILT